jgi:hypothetical protein
MKEIPLTRNKVALVDDEDYEYLSQWKWHAQPDKNNWYAVREQSWIENGKRVRTSMSMHREVLKLKSFKEHPVQVDHRNHDGLDNRKGNLRRVDNSKNMANRRSFTGVSKYKGVFKSGKNWRVRIQYNKQLLNLGSFPNEDDAAKAYDSKAKELFGEFAHLNFK